MIRLTPLFLLPLLAAWLTACGADANTQYQRAMERAATYRTANQLDEARLSILAALKAKPDDPSASFELAQVLVEQKRFGDAVEAYETALNFDPQHFEARLQLASLLLAGNNLELAESNLGKLLERDPNNIQALLLKGTIEMRRRDLKSALDTFQLVLTRDPKNLAAIASLGDIALQNGDQKQAESLYGAALKNDPESTPLQLALADLYLRQGRNNEAESMLTNLAERSPTDTELRFFLGDLLLGKGEGEKAAAHFHGVLEHDPKQLAARDRLYDLALFQQRPEDAFQLTTQLIELAPTEPGTEYFRGRDAELRGDSDTAYRHYLTAIEGLGTFSPVFRRLGIIELRLGRSREGVEHLTQAVTLDPKDVAARLSLAQHLFSRHEVAQAKEHVERLLAISPHQLGATLLRGDIAVIEGDYATAERTYQALQRKFPDSPAGLQKMALLEERRGRNPEAIALYTEALKTDTDVTLPLRRLTSLLRKERGRDSAAAELERLSHQTKRFQPEYKVALGALLLSGQIPTTEEKDRSRAQTLFEEALQERPNMPDALFGLAQLHEQRGEYKEAEQLYKKLSKQRGELSTRAKLLLATSYERQGKSQDAIVQYRELLSLSPRFAPAANNLAWLLVSTSDGDLEEALKYALIAKEEMPKDPGITDTLAWVYHRRGSSRAALPLIEEAIALSTRDGGPSPELLFHLGAIRHALNDPPGARTALEAALKHPEFPSKQHAQELLKTL